MSIIGPRPQTRRCFEAFPESAKDAIVSVRPGLSGIGSIFHEELMLNDADNADEYYDKVIMPHKAIFRAVVCKTLFYKNLFFTYFGNFLCASNQ